MDFEFLMQVCQRETDYSDGFTKKVSVLGDLIGSALNASIYHDTDMNYSASQKLQVYVGNDKKYLKLENSNAQDLWKISAFIINIYVSSKANLYYIDIHKKINTREAVFPKVIPSFVKTKVSEVKKFMEENGFLPIPEDFLEKTVDGYVTDLERKPATIFEIIFSEI